MKSKSSLFIHEISEDLQDYPYNNKKQISPINNLIEVLNAEYLLKFVNYDNYDSKRIFERAKVLSNQLSFIKPISIKQKNPFNAIKYMPLTQKQLNMGQKSICEKIQQRINQCLNYSPSSRILSIHQLRQIAQQKLKQCEINKQKQIQKSRRSYQYVQQLKSRVIQKTQRREVIILQRTKQQSINHVFQQLNRIDQLNQSIKIQFYSVEKAQDYQTQAMKQKLLQRWKQNHRIYRNCIEQYITLNVGQSRNESLYSTKHQKFNLTNLNSPKIVCLQKYINSYYLDDRQLNLITIESQTH